VDGVGDPLGPPVAARGDDGELVSADPVGRRRQAGARGRERGRKPADVLVARLVAVGVVRGLQAVEVDQKRMQGGVGGQRPADVLLEAAVVAKAGEAVAQGCVAQPRHLAAMDLGQPPAQAQQPDGEPGDRDAQDAGDDDDDPRPGVGRLRRPQAGVGHAPVGVGLVVDHLQHVPEQRPHPGGVDRNPAAVVVGGQRRHLVELRREPARVGGQAGDDRGVCGVLVQRVGGRDRVQAGDRDAQGAHRMHEPVSPGQRRPGHELVLRRADAGQGVTGAVVRVARPGGGAHARAGGARRRDRDPRERRQGRHRDERRRQGGGRPAELAQRPQRRRHAEARAARHQA
jgi:hypothetical protein